MNHVVESDPLLRLQIIELLMGTLTFTDVENVGGRLSETHTEISNFLHNVTHRKRSDRQPGHESFLPNVQPQLRLDRNWSVSALYREPHQKRRAFPASHEFRVVAIVAIGRGMKLAMEDGLEKPNEMWLFDGYEKSEVCKYCLMVDGFYVC